MWLARVCAWVCVLWLLPASSSAQSLPENTVDRALSTERPARRWRYIVVHHSATPGGNPRAFEAWHRSPSRHFALGMAYHFVIGNGRGMPDGAIEAGSRWRLQQQGAHIAAALRDEETGANLASESIGICLVGNFEHSEPTRAQRAALQRLLAVLQRRYAIASSRVQGHSDIHPGHTACPGRALRTLLASMNHSAPELVTRARTPRAARRARRALRRAVATTTQPNARRRTASRDGRSPSLR